MLITIKTNNKKFGKPISRVLSWTIIPLGVSSLIRSSNLPASNAGRAMPMPIWSCYAWSLPCRELLPATRCALTAPFHPYRRSRTSHEHLGGLLSVALSVGSRRPGVTWHLALRSPDFPPPVKPAATVWRARARQYSCVTHHARESTDSTVLEIKSALIQLVFTKPCQLRGYFCRFLQWQFSHQKIQQVVYI